MKWVLVKIEGGAEDSYCVYGDANRPSALIKIGEPGLSRKGSPDGMYTRVFATAKRIKRVQGWQKARA